MIMPARKAIQFAVCLFVTIVVASATVAQPQEKSQMHLALDLVDGSHVIGVPKIKSVPVQTSYAKMDIPLEEIASIKIENDRETASIELQNGDRLTGVLNLNSVQLQTIFGEVSFELRHATAIHVVTTGAITKDLVLYYSFDEDKGDKVTDKSKNKIDGSNGGAEWIPDGIVGGALRFSPNTGYVRIPHNSDLEFLDRDFSAALWIRPDTFETPGSDAATLLDFESGGWRGWMIRFSGYFPSVSLGGAGEEQPVLRTRPRIHEWTFIAITYSEQRNELSGYINGKLDMRQKINLNLTTSPTDYAIGNNIEIPNQRYYGDMDEVMVYSRVLNEDEIDTLYHRGMRKAQ
jgi:hypothetical protein